MSDAPQASTDATNWQLTPLTPEYRDREHNDYVKAIDTALNNPKIRNIALSGHYGVGKSSILIKVAEKYENRVVELSLSTLTPIEASSIDGALPKQATTPTNRIQQEIVKQLLYREEPHKTPGSRFRRIERFDFWRELSIACLIGITVTIIFLLTGWTEKLATTFTPQPDLGWRTQSVILALAISMAVSVRCLFHGRIHIRQFSAGAATVTLDDKSMSYFDQYLDEIVYFFEVSKRDIVLFEDIDRFNDSHIFETLRSLNTLLNSSPQINKPIRFIYAIKDSIFDRIGLEQEGRELEKSFQNIKDPAQAEVVRANRTKFFDLVIPVVPFITHRSARNLVTQLLQEIDHKIDEELIDLAGRYVPDMRLLKNVRNEFIVFRDRIFSGDGEKLNLSETDLFAMMLYKSTHLTDFEAVRIGQSKLDQLYDMTRKLVVMNVRKIEHEVRIVRHRQTHLDGVARQCSKLGDQLIAHAERTARAVGIPYQHGGFSFNSAARTLDDLRGMKFWTEFALEPGEPVLQWSTNHQYQQRSMSFTRKDLAAALSIRFEPENWKKANLEELNTTLAEHFDNLKFLRSADTGDLIKRQEFLVEHDGSEQSLDAVARQFLTEGLAYQLVRAGYINRNFTLYTSTFHGDRVSTAATNFIIHHIERDAMDEHFLLGGNDVDAVIRERGPSALSESAFYNIAILDRVLRTHVKAADIMVRSLMRFGDEQKRFLQAYLISGNERVLFIERIATLSPRVLVYLVSQVELDESTRLKLMSVALESLANNMEYQTDSAVSAYLETHYAELLVLTSASITASSADRIAKVFSKVGIRLPRLAPLSYAARQAFVAQDLYVINRENLAIAMGSDTSLALDMVRVLNKGAYEYVLGSLNAYLLAVDGCSATVDSKTHFVTVVEDVLAADACKVSDVIARASESCTISDLANVSESAWIHLARNKRFPATFSNVSRYIGVIGELDVNLAEILSSVQQITDHQTSTEADKAQLAKIILAASKYLPSAFLRTKLVASLELSDFIHVNEISPEKGELFALLLKDNIIADDADTYAHLLNTDWPTLERVIRESSNFKSYVTPALARGFLAELLRSDKVDLATKTKIADNASEFIEGSDRDDLAQLARFATQNGNQLTLDVVEQLASKGVPARDVIDLLESHLQGLSSSQLFGILHSLRGDYLSLTSVGWEKPKIPDTPANHALLEVLKKHGIVNTYKSDNSLISVNKRRK